MGRVVAAGCCTRAVTATASTNDASVRILNIAEFLLALQQRLRPLHERGEELFGFLKFGVPAFFVLAEEVAVIAAILQDPDRFRERELSRAGDDVAPAVLHRLRV